jgi:geranylgeranyl diphosphate synthase, type I
VIRERALGHSSPPKPQPQASTPAAFGRLRPLIDAGLRRAVESLSSHLAPVAEYHLGWRDTDGREVHADGGKAVRPTIVLLAAEAVGADAAAALPGAVAIELVHNFSLLHDDVMDGDRERRHRPTVWALFGLGQAIVVGDALLALAERHLLEDPRPEAHQAAALLTRATAEMIQGQAEDLAFESRLDVSLDACLGMTGRKTGALLSCAATLGGVLGGGDAQAVEALRSFGRHLGLAFQAVDDVLGIWGDPAVTGKPAAGDLRQHKKSIPVVHALSSGGAGASDVRRFLSNGEQNEGQVARTVARLEEAGSREWTLGLADQHLSAALDALRHRGLEPRAVEQLDDIAVFVARRDF